VRRRGSHLDGTLVGLLALSDEGEARWIDQLSIAPACVGQSIGSFCVRHAQQMLAPPVRLYTFQANAGGRRFYERHGFRTIVFRGGAGNEECCPDVLYERVGTGT
jgi:ribosomal protein S18 acetylase RimI-like enzyme